MKSIAVVKPISSCILRSEEHTSELQSRPHLVCRLLLEKKNQLLTFLGGLAALVHALDTSHAGLFVAIMFRCEVLMSEYVAQVMLHAVPAVRRRELGARW